MSLSAWVLLGLIIAGLAVVGSLDITEGDRVLSRYCEMVELNKTDATLGWPDYKELYEEHCK